MELNKLYNMDCLIGMQEIPSGSATTAVAAIRTWRNWIGYEMNTEFYNRALKRID